MLRSSIFILIAFSSLVLIAEVKSEENHKRIGTLDITIKGKLADQLKDPRVKEFIERRLDLSDTGPFRKGLQNALKTLIQTQVGTIKEYPKITGKENANLINKDLTSISRHDDQDNKKSDKKKDSKYLIHKKDRKDQDSNSDMSNETHEKSKHKKYKKQSNMRNAKKDEELESDVSKNSEKSSLYKAFDPRIEDDDAKMGKIILSNILSKKQKTDKDIPKDASRTNSGEQVKKEELPKQALRTKSDFKIKERTRNNKERENRKREKGRIVKSYKAERDESNEGRDDKDSKKGVKDKKKPKKPEEVLTNLKLPAPKPSKLYTQVDANGESIPANHAKLTKHRVEATALRGAFGEACLKLVVSKCYKACQATAKRVCDDRRCREYIRPKFLQNAKTECIDAFDARTLNQNKTSNTEDLTRSGDLTAACFAAHATSAQTSPKKKPERRSSLNVLRNKYERACQRESSSKCELACTKAFSSACGDDCRIKYKRSCRQSCDDQYINNIGDSESSDSDSSSSSSSASD